MKEEVKLAVKFRYQKENIKGRKGERTDPKKVEGGGAAGDAAGDGRRRVANEKKFMSMTTTTTS